MNCFVVVRGIKNKIKGNACVCVDLTHGKTVLLLIIMKKKEIFAILIVNKNNRESDLNLRV